ncbi:MAG TPA: alpha/beta fold hydrolase [bacterium]|jgi:pimeloyl-ACP methyl ester carboxylesterase/predicted glycosyltransferase
MRAKLPDQAGWIERGGVKSYYEAFGTGEPTILLVPSSPIVHSRQWKGQVPYLARHFRVVTFDGRGNGRSDRPDDAEAYGDDEIIADTLRVMDETETEKAIIVVLCHAWWVLSLAASYPERVLGLIAIAPSVNLAPIHPNRAQYVQTFDEPQDNYEGWARTNRHYWLQDWRGYVTFFFDKMLPEPHSTKQLEDIVDWCLLTTPQTMLLNRDAPRYPKTREEAEEVCRKVRCPVLVAHGDLDQCQLPARGEAVARLTGGQFVSLRGAGHMTPGRDPVKVNTLIKDFADTLKAPAPRPIVWERALTRPRRVLFISSSIGLGHIQRDIAVARELRALVPDLEIHWWAQHPATEVLTAAGETIHPQNHLQALESAHWEEEASHHELHAFYAFRRMDEIFAANFMLFHDITRETPYDIWIGDESWEVDYFLHENPELKCAPYVFMTDVIGFLPVDPIGDPRETMLTADYNAEMIEQRARYPHLRDLSLYVGEFDELPDEAFGPELPNIRDWARRWFEPIGYVVPFDPLQYRDPTALRTRLGYGTGYPLLFAAVGGTGVGRELLEQVADGFAQFRERQPAARMVMVTGPRIDPGGIPDVPGLEKRAYVHNLFEHLACADAAIAQGGLSTTMELVATRRPFAYVPLRKHWEQQHYVDYRLRHYNAGIRLDFRQITPAVLAAMFQQLLASPVSYREVPRDSARRAATRIASLLLPR